MERCDAIDGALFSLGELIVDIDGRMEAQPWMGCGGGAGGSFESKLHNPLVRPP